MCKTDYGGGGGGGGRGGGKNNPKIDYVICERPLSNSSISSTKNQQNKQVPGVVLT